MTAKKRPTRTAMNTGTELPQSTPATPHTGQPPLTVDAVRSMRFSISKPAGYYFPQVEDFVAHAVDTLTYWEQHAFELANDLHATREELVDEQTRSASLQTQVELFRVQGDPLTNADGSYVTESQQAGDTSKQEIAALRHRAETAEAQAQAEYQRAEELSIQAYAADARAVQADANAILCAQQAAATEATVTALTAATPPAPEPEPVAVGAETPAVPAQEHVQEPIVEDQAQPDQATEPEPASFVAQTDEATPTAAGQPVMSPLAVIPAPDAWTPRPLTPVGKIDPIGDENEVPVFQDVQEGVVVEDQTEYATYEEEPHLAGGATVMMFPLDSELPPGTLIPPRESGALPFRYNEAAPGEPLVTQDVPVEEWAPELGNNRHF